MVRIVKKRALWYEEETLGSVEALERKIEASCTDCTDRAKGTDDQAVPSCAVKGLLSSGKSKPARVTLP